MSRGLFSVEDVFRNVGKELAGLEALAKSVEDTIARLVGSLDEKPGKDLKSLQEIDLLVQSLGDLSTFLNALAENKSDCNEIEIKPAVEILKLARIRASLMGEREPEIEDDKMFLL